jgi:tRNA(adenine34) deaminase
MTDHKRYMQMALDQATLALENGEFPVGCVMVYQGTVVASGKRCNSVGTVNEMDHAEMVALRQLLASTIQVNMQDVTVYSTMEPCLMCYATLIVNGLRKFVYSYEDAMGGGTNLPLHHLSPLYRDLEVEIRKGVLRQQSLGNFKEFFANPDNDYLKGSLLAEYTLSQKL